jgi:hypothetical protein
MNAPSEDIKDMLVADSGLGLTFGTNLFKNKEPASPRNCVTIFDTYGYRPDLALVDQGYERPSIQIRVRNNKQETAWSLIDDIKNLLHGKSNETWNGAMYTVIYCASGPALLDWDDNGNVRLIINFNLQRR